MNIKDFRAAAYQKNIELPKNEQNPEQKIVYNNNNDDVLNNEEDK